MIRSMRSRFYSAAIVALLLPGCASVEPSSSPTAPSATSSIPESPQPAPTPTPSSTHEPSRVAAPSTDAATEPGVGPGDVVEVITTDLVMRTGPDVSDLSEIYPGRLTAGDRLYIVEGPVTADGYDWVLADPYQIDFDAEAWLRFGWVAVADKTGEPWITAIEPECPRAPTITTLAELHGALRLYCFAGETLVLAGDVACHDLGPPIPTASPAWLTWQGCNLNPPGAAPYDPVGPGPHVGIGIHYPPGTERLTGRLEITAHLDDNAASSCRLPVPTSSGDVYTQPLTDREVQLWCRASLVVDAARMP